MVEAPQSNMDHPHVYAARKHGCAGVYLWCKRVLPLPWLKGKGCGVGDTKTLQGCPACSIRFEATEALDEHVLSSHGGWLELRLALARDLGGLTPMQTQLLRLRACGASDHDLARVLGMSASTVRGHRLRLRKRVEAARSLIALDESVQAGVSDGQAYLETLHCRGDAAERLRAARALLILHPRSHGHDLAAEADFGEGMLASKRAALRGLAARLLAVCLDEGRVPALEGLAMEDPDPWVRQECVEAMAALGGRTAIRAIRQVLRKDGRPALRATALLALMGGLLAAEEEEELLLEVVASEKNAAMRREAGRGLERMRDGGRPCLSGKGLPRERAPEDA